MKRTLIGGNTRYDVTEMTFRALRTAPLLLLLLTGCEKDGGTPSFVRFHYPEVKDANDHIIPSSVTDLWVYANDEAIGVWQPGRRIPVLDEGATRIKLIAGIRKNGIADARIQYPFYATATMDADLIAGEELSLQPVFTHYAAPQWTEGFESSGSNLDLSESQDTLIVHEIGTEPDEVLVGNRSGGFQLSTAAPMFRAISTGDPAFPGGGTNVFLEFDCKADMRFIVGVRYVVSGQTYAVPYVYVSPTGSGDQLAWKHMYIDLGSAWPASNTTDRRFYLQGDLENGATSGVVTLDNLQVFF